MATRLAFAAASRARPPVLLRVASTSKAPCLLRVTPHAYHPTAYRGSAAALISPSPCTRTSTRAISGKNSTAPSSPATEAGTAGAGAPTDSPAATTQGPGSATIGASGASGAAGVAGAGGAAHAEGSSSAAAVAGSETVSSGADSSSDPSSSASGGGGGGGSRGPLSWGAVGLLGVVASLAVGYYRMKWEEKQNQTASKVSRKSRNTRIYCCICRLGLVVLLYLSTSYFRYSDAPM